MAEPVTESADVAAPARSGPVLFVHRLRVRYSECDPQGVVFNPQYLAFADHTLTELWRELYGGYMAMLERGVDVVVAEARLRFRASARFDEELDVAVDVAQLGTTSMTFHYLITRAADGAPLAEVELRYVWVDRDTGAKTPIPDWARSKLAR
ncbi:MAG TPA: thioesterase family protein [Solirubrobacteraceae bacterium]|nr:thioesterase family protein [Solirubrobacteraceae bacterium]